ncbi:MAG: histidinol-phosphatase HisJ [Spirochaetia bacterium]
MEWKYNYHTHTDYCDGNGKPEAYVEAALKGDVKVLGFSSHAPCPFETEWTMKPEKLAAYVQEIGRLRRLYAKDITILTGLEVDYIPYIISPTDAFWEQWDLDFIIGSVHFLGKLSNGNYWTIDNTEDELRTGVLENFDNDPKQAVLEYYTRVANLALRHKPDIIGHFDLIKKNNNGIFDTNEKWYKDVVLSALEGMKSVDTVLEINTGGIARGRTDELYPADWIIASAAKMNIPMTMNSDAHQPDQITAEFVSTLEKLPKLGVKSLWSFHGKGWREHPL